MRSGCRAAPRPMDPRGRCSAARRSFDGRPDSRGSGLGGRLGDQDTKTLGGPGPPPDDRQGGLRTGTSDELSVGVDVGRPESVD